MDDYSHSSPTCYKLNDSNEVKKMHFIETELAKPKTPPRPLFDNFKDFMLNTSLHGFRYIMDDKFTWIERGWWLIMVICSILACAFFIEKIWIKWDETPVIVSFAEISNSVWHIPFPAVTICTETKTRQNLFNFTKAYTERWSDPPTISPENLTTYEDLLLLCSYAPSGGPEFVNASSIEALRRLAPTRDEIFKECLWNDLTCDQMFSHTLTKDGYCFTFNMLSADQMFRTENLHHDYYHVAGKNSSNWSVEEGYPPNETIDTYPLRGPSYGGVEFEIILLTDIRDLDQICRGPVQGFKVWLHNPAELPNMGQNFYRLPIEHQLTAAIEPRIMDTSEGLRNYSPEKRQCYFPDERYLRFFRTYSQRNCELECSSNHTALRCGCVPLYMPQELSLSKSSVILELKPKVEKCDCLQACTELKYDAEVSQAVYDLSSFKRNKNSDIAKGWRLPSGLVIYFSEEQFTSLRRSELYGHVDFLANCGGIMGLFMGFSFLSLIEIIYYFTMRLWCHIRNSTVVIANK